MVVVRSLPRLCFGPTSAATAKDLLIDRNNDLFSLFC